MKDLTMGNVVEFELKSGKTPDPHRQATDIASMSLALARHLQIVEVCGRSFEKDMKSIVEIACSTTDIKRRERLLRELGTLKKQLLLAMTIASSAKRSMQGDHGEAPSMTKA